MAGVSDPLQPGAGGIKRLRAGKGVSQSIWIYFERVRIISILRFWLRPSSSSLDATGL